MYKTAVSFRQIKELYVKFAD